MIHATGKQSTWSNNILNDQIHLWSSHNDAMKKAEQILECVLHEEHSISYPWGWANKACVYVTWLSEKVGLLTRKKHSVFFLIA